MRLFYDHNLSFKLVNRLTDLFPDSQHVRNVGLADAEDQAVWNHALKQGLTIISKDSDFHDQSLLRGHPPKVIWLRLGNCSTQDIEDLIRSMHLKIKAFAEDEESSFLALS